MSFSSVCQVAEMYNNCFINDFRETAAVQGGLTNRIQRIVKQKPVLPPAILNVHLKPIFQSFLFGMSSAMFTGEQFHVCECDLLAG